MTQDEEIEDDGSRDTRQDHVEPVQRKVTWADMSQDQGWIEVESEKKRKKQKKSRSSSQF